MAMELLKISYNSNFSVICMGYHSVTMKKQQMEAAMAFPLVLLFGTFMYTCNLFASNSSPSPSVPPIPPCLLPSLNFMYSLYIFFNSLGPVSASNMYIGGESSTGAWTVYMRVPHP